MIASFRAIIEKDPRHSGVRRINLVLLRVLYGLMFFMLGQTVWSHILSHTGRWEADDAMAWSVWAAFSLLAGIGMFRPLLMLPVLLLEIIYKSIWLWLVAWPLWQTGQLAGSDEAYQTGVFVGVCVPILIMPWGYVVDTYLRRSKSPFASAAPSQN